MRAACLTLIVLTACQEQPTTTPYSPAYDSGPAPAYDSVAVEDEDDDDVGSTCDELEIRYDGPDAPMVGDTWTLILYCDGALVLGSVVIQVDPPEAATVAETLMTFSEAGTCEINAQAGSTQASLTVEVTEAW